MKYGIVIVHCLLVATLAAIAPGCSQTASQAVENNSGTASTDGTKAAPGPPAEPPALVRVATTIEQKIIAPEFRALGNVRPRHLSVVASGAEGVVAEFSVEVGDFVQEGAPLSQLRNESTNLDIKEQEAILSERREELKEISVPREEDKAEAQARKLSADIMYSNAKRRMEELRALSERGAANQSEVKDAQDTLDAAEQTRLAAVALLSKITNPRRETVMQAEARVEAQEKHVAFLEAERDKRTTKAPFAGFVVEEHTYIGQWLSKGAPVVTLSQLDEVEVEVQIDQQYIDQIAPGRQVTLHVQGTGSRNGLSREWTGVVDSVVPRSNWQSGSRSFPVIIRIRNEMDESTMPPIPALREGMMAEAEFRGQDIEAKLVPKDSMVRTSRGNFIYVINPPTEGNPLSVRQVVVTPGISVGTLIQVTGENLEVGMQVVTDGAPRLRPFKTVQVMKDEGTGKSK